MTIEEFNRRKKKIEEMKQEQARAEGAYAQALAQLKTLGADSIGEGERMLADYIHKKERSERELSNLLEEFEELTKDLA